MNLNTVDWQAVAGVVSFVVAIAYTDLRFRFWRGYGYSPFSCLEWTGLLLALIFGSISQAYWVLRLEQPVVTQLTLTLVLYMEIVLLIIVLTLISRLVREISSALFKWCAKRNSQQ